MSKTVPKKYGLILKKSSESLKPVVKPIAAAFADDDDDEIEAVSSSKVSASTIRSQVQAKYEHEKALAEDPTVFDYDSIYDELQAKKNEKIAEVKAADKQRKSKYAEQILETHKKRLLAQQSREERKQQKEREAEAGQFDDKEKFVTSAYRQQLAEMENFRLQEAAENRLDELTAVEKQKSGMWKGGFYRTLLNDMARDSNTIKIEEKEVEQKLIKPASAQETMADRIEHAKKLSLLRKSSNKDETLPPLSTDKPIKKSIYSDASDEETEMSAAPPVQLKPGLNILKPQVKKLTKAEQVQRHFTPSPEHSVASSSSSSEEDSSRKRKKHTGRRERIRERSHERRTRRRSRESDSEKRKSARYHAERSREHYSAEKKSNKRKKHDEQEVQKTEGEEKQEPSKKIMKEKTKEERLQIIKKILAHRNGPEEIEAMRQRYLERKRNGVVPLPL